MREKEVVASSHNKDRTCDKQYIRILTILILDRREEIPNFRAQRGREERNFSLHLMYFLRL